MAEHTEERSYIAFISYRHKELDREAAIALQKKIEHFKIPKELRDESGNDRLGYCFRDEDELPTSSSLSDSIRYALDHTRFLIVICTPDLPKSEWCTEEIRYFLSTHDRDHLLAVLVSGEPEESFSPYMTHVYDENGDVLKNVEPLAANITGTPEHYSRPKFKKESIRIIAALLGVPFDELWQRERRYQNRRKAAFGGLAFAAMAVFAIVVGAKNLQISAKNAEITAQNEQITAQNEQITAQNTEITEKNQELQVREGKLLTEAGQLLLEGHDLFGAKESAKAALEIDGVHTEGAELLLANALGAYNTENLRLDLSVEQETSVDRCAMLSDGSITFTSDHYGVVRAFQNKEELWSFSAVPAKNRAEYLDDSRSTELYLVNNESVLLVGNAYYVAGLSPKTGSLIWELPKKTAVNFLEVSPDGTTFAVFNDFADDCVSFHSTANGTTFFWSYLPAFTFDYYGLEVNYPYTFSDYSMGKSFGGCFSADGNYFMFGAELPTSMAELLTGDTDAWFEENLDSDEFVQDSLDEQQGKARQTPDSSDESDADKRKDVMIYCLADLQDHSLRVVGEEPVHSGMNPLFGFRYDPKTDSLFFARHDDLSRSTYAGVIDSDGKLSYTLQHQNIKYNKTSVPSAFLEGNETLVVNSANYLYIFDKSSGEFLGRFELDRNITFCDWVDQENDVLLVIQEDSVYHVYPLAGTGTDVFLSEGINFSLNNLTNVTLVGDGIFQWDEKNQILNAADGKVLLVTSDLPQKTMVSEFFTDPNAKMIPTKAVPKKACYSYLSPDGNDLYLAEKQDSDLVLHSVDPATGKVLGAETFKDVNFIYSELLGILPGGKEILYGNRLFRADGSTEYLEHAESGLSSFEYHAVIGQASDGVLTTACLARGDDGKDRFLSWKNEKAFVTFSASDDTQWILSDEDSMTGTPGETVLLKICYNGQIVAGVRHKNESRFTGYFIVSPDGEFSTLASAGGARPQSLFASANTDFVFAVLEEDGVIRFYDPAKETPALEITSPDGFTGAAALCFDASDQYFGVLSYNGELSLFDADDGSLLMKAQSEGLATTYGTPSMSLTLSKDGKRILCINRETEWNDRSNASVYDLENFEHVADIKDIYSYIQTTDQTVLFKYASGTRKFFLCPLYSRESLLASAK